MQESLLFHSACTNFAPSEGRNPWVKNAFLALSYVIKSQNFTRRDEDEDMSILFLYMIVRVQPTLCFVKVYKQYGVFVLLFISLMVFGDTNNMMSVTSPYAFLVVLSQTHTADFGGVIGGD